MGSFSLVHWLIVILVVILLFGRGRISDLMGDMAKGINSFKKGLADDGTTPPPGGYAPPPQGYAPPPPPYVPPHIAPPQAVPPHVAPAEPSPTATPAQPPVRDEVPRS